MKPGKKLNCLFLFASLFLAEGIFFLPLARAIDPDSCLLSVTIEDVEPPSAITDLSASSGLSEGSVELTWTAPYENGNSGGAVSSYILRYATFSIIDLGLPIDTTAWWNHPGITNAAGTPSPPKEPGQVEGPFLIGGLEPGVTFYFAIRSFDDGGNFSDIDDNAYLTQANTVPTDLNPSAPQGLTVLAEETKMTLNWNANSEIDLWCYRIYRDAQVPEGPLNEYILIATTTVTTFVDTDVLTGTTYYYRIAALDKGAPNYPGTARESSFSDPVIGYYTPPSDFIAPAIPLGIDAQIAGQNLTISWTAVTKNSDGTPLTDLAGYVLYVSSYLFTAPERINSTAVTETNYSLPLVSDLLYYRVRAIDTYRHESADSFIVDNSAELNLFILFDDSISYFRIPRNIRTQIYQLYNSYQEDLFIEGERRLNEEEKRVIKSYRLQAKRSSTGNVIPDFIFPQAEAELVLGYSVINGQIVNGSPSLSARTAPVTESTQASSELALYWFNGVEWIKLGGKVDPTRQIINMKTRLLGSYQLRHVLRSTSFTLNAVYPRIFTPNGDGWNDVVNFNFENPKDSVVEGEIYDITGAQVDDIQKGATENTLVWDGKDRWGQIVPGGVYIYQIKAEGKKINGTVVVGR